MYVTLEGLDTLIRDLYDADDSISTLSGVKLQVRPAGERTYKVLLNKRQYSLLLNTVAHVSLEERYNRHD